MSPGGEVALDLDAYLGRIGYAGNLAPTPAVLEGLHLAHATSIPFENLDIQLGRPIRLDLGSIQAKLVGARRGGYCFEQNKLFGAVLERIGFRVRTLLARVRLGASRVLPRTHMILLVDGTDGPVLADVGFGTGGLLHPIPLSAGPEVRQFAWSFRMAQEPGLWVLQTQEGDAWQDLYAFSLEPQHPVDFEMSNWYTSTHPDSRFVQTLTAQRSAPEARFLLRNRVLIVIRGSQTLTRTVEDDEELLRVLSENFGLDFPPGTRFRCLAGK
jgi:N-hydroxyarylamine O-acetyltransferase